MEPILFRVLLSCLLVWLICKTLDVLKVSDPPKWIIELVVVILAWVYIFVGWMIP